MKKFLTMDNTHRLSRSMPLLLYHTHISPVAYRALSPRWPERRFQPRHYYINGIRTKLIGAGSYPSFSRFPRRLIVCGPDGRSFQKLTKSSSITELSYSGVFRSTDNLCSGEIPRKTASCDDVSQGRLTPTWGSESGVSLADSRTEVGSVGEVDKDVEAESQCSFGSSGAFCDVTRDSELDRQDSDAISEVGSMHDLDQLDNSAVSGTDSAHGLSQMNTVDVVKDYVASMNRDSKNKQTVPGSSCNDCANPNCHLKCPPYQPPAWIFEAECKSMQRNASVVPQNLCSSQMKPQQMAPGQGKTESIFSIDNTGKHVQPSQQAFRRCAVLTQDTASEVRQPTNGDSVHVALSTVEHPQVDSNIFHSVISKRRLLNERQLQDNQLLQQQSHSLFSSENNQCCVTKQVRILEAGPMITIPNNVNSSVKLEEKANSIQIKNRHTKLGFVNESVNGDEKRDGQCFTKKDNYVTPTTDARIQSLSSTNTPAISPGYHVRGGGGKQTSVGCGKEIAGAISSLTDSKNACWSRIVGSKNSACPISVDEEQKNSAGDKQRLINHSDKENIGGRVNTRLELLQPSSWRINSETQTSLQDSIDFLHNRRISGTQCSFCVKNVDLKCVSCSSTYSSSLNLAGETQKEGIAKEATACNKNNDNVYHNVTYNNNSNNSSVFLCDWDGARAVQNTDRNITHGKEEVEKQEGTEIAHSIAKNRPFPPLYQVYDSCEKTGPHAARSNCNPSPIPPHSFDRRAAPTSSLHSNKKVGFAQLGVNTKLSTVLSTHTLHPLPKESSDTVKSVSTCDNQRLLLLTTTALEESCNLSSGVCHKHPVTIPHHSSRSGYTVDESNANSDDTTKSFHQPQGGKEGLANKEATAKEKKKRNRGEGTTTTCVATQLPLPCNTGEQRGQGRCQSHTETSGRISHNCGLVCTTFGGIDVSTHLCTPHKFVLPQIDKEMAESREVKTTSASFDLLDSLQQQLSLLSSDEASYTTDPWSRENTRQSPWYKDHAEASLPQVHSGVEDKNIILSTGSVSVTLKKDQWQNETTQVSGSAFLTTDTRDGSYIAERNTEYLYGSVISDTRRETSRSQSRMSQVLSSTQGSVFSYDSGRGGDKDKDGLPTYPVEMIKWQAPVSSSEYDDSDGNYTSLSTTDSSHHHSECEVLSSDCEKENYDNVTSFTDFVTGLQGQYTSDRSSVHHRLDMITTDFRSSRLHSSIQETILEADDESETADEMDTTTTSIGSYKSTFHFSVMQSTPKSHAVSAVPGIKVWNTDERVVNLCASQDGTSTMSPVDTLQDLSDKLSSFDDVSFESDTLHESYTHDFDDLHTPESHFSACSSPTPSDISEGHKFSAAATAEVRKQTDPANRVKLAEPLSTVNKTSLTITKPLSSRKIARRNLVSNFKRETSKKTQWIEDRVLLFQKLLNEFESQCKSPEQILVEEMYSFESRQNGDNVTSVVTTESDPCDHLYRSFTEETLEKRQNHVCPFVEDHMPTFRFKRFLKKKHNSRLTGRKTFKVRHQLDKLSEVPGYVVDNKAKCVSETDLHRNKPLVSEMESPIPSLTTSPFNQSTSSPTKLRSVLSDTFPEDFDVKQSFSDSAYSTLSELTSHHVSDLDSTMKSMCSSGGDVSSIGTDLSLDSDMLTSLSDVFDQFDLCEGEIDQALLDRLQVGHYKADTL